jgi:general secretion pathway protein H
MKPLATKGFTLLEIALVITIIASVVVYAMPKLIGSQQGEVRAAIRELGVISREVKRSAKLYNATYRLVIELAPQEASRTTDTPYEHKYWVEKAPGSLVLKSQKDDSQENGVFEKDPRFQKKPHKLPKVLPSGLSFSKVETANLKNPITQGKAYIYYFPEGLVTESAIGLKFNENMFWTLVIHPLTGKVTVFDKEVRLSELVQ